MQPVYKTTIEHVLEVMENHIGFFRNLSIFKRNMTCLFFNTLIDELHVPRLKIGEFSSVTIHFVRNIKLLEAIVIKILEKIIIS